LDVTTGIRAAAARAAFRRSLRAASRTLGNVAVGRLRGRGVCFATRTSLGWMLLAALVGCGADHQRSEPSALNVVLISLDTLAADHLGLYGYARDTSPHLDRYAKNAIVFENAYSTAPKTPESHMSMFTSLYPSVHRVFTIDDPSKLNVLDPKIRTLAEILKHNGYTTVGFHGGGYVAGQLGFSRGFDSYRRGSQRTAEEWLWKNAAKNKFFLFYHTYHVHDPYTPKPPYDRRFDPDYDGPIVHDRDALRALAGSTEWVDYSATFWKTVDKSDPAAVAHVVALYDGAIAELDAELIELLDAIDRYAPETIVIILSDHGEEFGQHGKFTHQQLYREVLHVPLIIRHPDHPGGERIDARVSLIDLAPTILALLSIPSDAQFQGRSLFGRTGGVAAARPVFSEFPLGGELALIDRDRKWMHTQEREELYDLREDPDERRDLLRVGTAGASDQPPPALEKLREEAARVTRDNASLRVRLGVQESTEAPAPAVLEQLRALGYLE